MNNEHETVTRVGLVEDQLLFLQGMKAILSSWKNIEVVFESQEGYTVVEKLNASSCVPDVMLVDFSLPSQNGTEFSGKETTMALRTAFPDMKIIILSVHDNENFIVQAIEHGAHGYLVKDSDPREVYDAICTVHTRGTYINQRALKALQRKPDKKNQQKQEFPGLLLTRREAEVLALVCQQLTAEEIGEKLFISVKTVNGHRMSLLEKTGAKNVAGLVIYAVKNNIVKI